MGTVYNNGINNMPRGWTKENEWNKRVYKTWCNMLERCYDEKYQEIHPTYIGCTVCDRWLLLSNFVEDITKIDGYELWLTNPNKRISLDKDIKSNGENKEYCLEECMLVFAEENTKQANKTRDNSYLQNRTGENHPLYGKHHSEEAKKKMSENHADFSGKNNPAAKKVAQCDKQGNIIKIWDYAKQVEEELGIKRSNICKCCKGKLKSAGGFVWKYAEEKD